MVRLTFNLLAYLNSDEQSVIIHSDRNERDKLQGQLDKAKRQNSKRNKRKRERLKYLSTARFHQVGVDQERAITSRPGFDITTPRHWRRGHVHQFWTGPWKENGKKIPYSEWSNKRKLICRWVEPTLINPNEPAEQVTNRTVIRGPGCQKSAASTSIE